ncbi:MAG: hypothetical protein D0433_00310 [Candidatus Thermochlorobacter aerophilum]|jgi:hypothetical protein|uniref:Response regulator n=1 Tax=Candidatus Thermochlorobacter aerophilus TaxID=1868324 RepID=A0A395M3V3_9BACT|nr:MAG: hypothetical protein D0433_01780 [Candidatus Thermochlorobacter aerophilum]RFM25509.1 MAG: hypothetical protein D0433_00310 [Candidatus Thermochlorobacter aerophilum]
MSSYIALFIPDLIFRTQVRLAMQDTPYELKFCISPDTLSEAHPPALAVFDLSFGELDQLERFRQRFPNVPTLAFLPHMQTQLYEQARTMGCTKVVSRFEFSKNIRKLLMELASNV